MEEKEIVLKRARNAVIARDFDLALRLYNSLVQDDSENIGLLSEIGNLYIKAGQDKKAVAYFKTIIELEPDNEDALNTMGGICRRIKEYDKSIEYLNHALAVGKGRAAIQYNLGFTYKSMGKDAEAIDCFQSVINDNPTDVLAYNHLGAIYARQKDYEKAVSIYRLGLQVDPNHPILQFNLAKAYEATGNDSEAISSYESALRAKPGWKDAVKAYAKLLLKLNRTAEAASIVQNAVSLYSDQSDLYYLLGRIFLQQDNYSKAEENLKKARKLAPDSAKILSCIAKTYEKSGKNGEAVEAAMQAEENNSEDIDLKAQTVRTLLSAKKFDAAGERLKSLQAKIPDDVRFLDLGGQYSICVNRPENSKAFYSKIEAMDSSYTEHLINAALRYKQTGKLDKAAEYIDSFIVRNPKDTGAWLLSGEIEEGRGNSETALKNYEEAFNIDPANFTAKESTARVESVIADEKVKREREALAASDREDLDKYVIEMQKPEEPIEEQEPTLAEAEEPIIFDFDVPPEESENLLEIPEPDSTDENGFPEQLLEDEDDVRDKTPEDDFISADDDKQESENAGNSENNEDENTNSVGGEFYGDKKFEDDVNSADNADEDFSDSKDESYAAPGERAETDSGAETAPAAEPPEKTLPKEQTAPVERKNPFPEPDDKYQEPAAAPANSGLSREDAARLEKTLREVSEKAEKAESAAEKAWNAAQLAADAAQSADAAQKIMNEQAETTSEDDSISDDKEESLPDENISQEPVCENLEENNSTEGEINSADEDSAAVIEPEEDSSFDDTNISDETEQDDSGKAAFDAEETAANAEKAVNAAEKAWNAAQKAADSAQAADAAQKYISEITENLNDEAGAGNAEEDNSSTSDSSYDEFMEQVSKMLPIISRILENKDDAKKYEREIALFKRLRAMGDILPEEKKYDFLCSHARLLLDYLIARLSGKPGLLITSKALRKTDVMHGMLDEVSPEDEKLYGRELILKVFADLQRLLPYLPDDNLSKALMNESETLIDRI
ncbi:MAG: tetratricopeptide repeat protein [Treponema sp.]